MDKTIKYVGIDIQGRRVYRGESGRLYCNTVTLGSRPPHYCTKLNNDFDGEPDLDMPRNWNLTVVDDDDADRNTIRVNSPQLHKLIAEKIMKVLKESLNGETPYDEMDDRLQEIGDAHVSRFYCDENQITLAVNMNTGSEGRIEAENIMKDFGYKLYDLGTNEPYVMMTFKRM